MDDILKKLAEKNGITLRQQDTEMSTSERLEALEEAVLEIIIGGGEQ